MRIAASVGLCIAACSTTPRGHVDVYAYTNPGGLGIGQGPAIEGAVIAFRDRNGDSRSTTTDATGHASGEVEAGGSVWCSQAPLLEQGTNVLYAYTDVQLGGTLVFGAPAATHSTIATMTINAQAPSPSMVSGVEVFVYIYSLCGNSLQVTSPSYTGSITLDDRCSGTVDLLAVQDTSEFADETWGPYQFLPAQPIVDGGTITFSSAGWKSYDMVTAQVADVGSATLTSGDVSSAFIGFTGAMGATTSGLTIDEQLPLVGPSLQVQAGLTLGTSSQSATVVTPLPPPTIDIATIAAPYVTTTGLNTPAAAWSYDDAGGTLTANAMITSYQWSDQVKYQEGVTATVVGPPAIPGPLPALELPAVFAGAQPSPDILQLTEHVALARYRSAANFDPLQAAMLGGLPTLQVGDSAASSEQ